MFKHVATEANRLGIEVNMNDDAGWCGSGGPWIKPEQAMQKVVWSERRVEGSVKVKLPQPMTVEGFYRDIAVLAVPAFDANDGSMADLSPKVTTSDPTQDKIATNV